MTVALIIGGFYKMRGGNTAFIERAHPTPWMLNGAKQEFTSWHGRIVETGVLCSWVASGQMMPGLVRRLPSGEFYQVEDELDIVDDLGNTQNTSKEPL